MKPLTLLASSALFYVTLLTIFGDTATTETVSPTVPNTAAIEYAPIEAPSVPIRTTVPMSTTSVEPSTTTAPSTSVVPLVGPDTLCQHWIPVAVQAGWPADRDLLETLASVMYRESRCQPTVVNTTSPDHGLLQVNEIHRAYVEQIYGIPFEEAMADPAKNLNFAWRLYSELEAAGRCGWAPWSLKCR